MNKKGFTLVEMAIVLVIIGILAGLTVYNLGGFGKKARDQKRINDLLRISGSIISYFGTYGRLPSTTNDDSVPFQSLGISTLSDPVSGWKYYYNVKEFNKAYVASCVETPEAHSNSPVKDTNLCFGSQSSSTCPNNYYCIEVTP